MSQGWMFWRKIFPTPNVIENIVQYFLKMPQVTAVDVACHSVNNVRETALRSNCVILDLQNIVRIGKLVEKKPITDKLFVPRKMVVSIKHTTSYITLVADRFF